MKDREKWLEKVDEFVSAHVFEVSTETSDKWINMLFEKRFINFLDYYEGQIVFKTKKGENEFKKEFKEKWTNGLKEYQEALRKAKSDELKEEIKKNGCKRKVDSPSKKKSNKKK
jgi:hypothetical protein